MLTFVHFRKQRDAKIVRNNRESKTHTNMLTSRQQVSYPKLSEFIKAGIIVERKLLLETIIININPPLIIHPKCDDVYFSFGKFSISGV